MMRVICVGGHWTTSFQPSSWGSGGVASFNKARQRMATMPQGATLIDNAVSFSPPGGVVTITAALFEMGARVTVEDEGPGIPEENLESIFERFYTTERPSFPEESGGSAAGAHFGSNSGLGLSIARQVTQSAGGRIFAENRAGGGTMLVVDLPVVRT